MGLKVKKAELVGRCSNVTVHLAVGFVMDNITNTRLGGREYRIL